MAFSKFNGSCYYLSAFREATTLELITNIPSFAFPRRIHVHFNLLEALSLPGRIKVAFCFQKPVCKTENLHWKPGNCWYTFLLCFFFFNQNQIEQLESEFERLHYLASEIVSNMYWSDLRLHWEAVTDATEPASVLKQCFTLLKGHIEQHFWCCCEKFI